jgi:hypothetical protein
LSPIFENFWSKKPAENLFMKCCTTAQEFQWQQRQGLPDFAWYNTPKLGKIYQMITKYTKWPWSIQNGCKIFQMTTKIYQYCIFQGPPKIPNWDFWFKIFHLATLTKTSRAWTSVWLNTEYRV